MSGDKESPERPPGWSAQKPLGEALRDRYQEILSEPVPERLKKLIEALKEKEKDQPD